VQDYTRVRLHGTNVLMSHYPYARSGDGPERGHPGRYLEWRLPDTGLGLIHAHTHHTEPHMIRQEPKSFGSGVHTFEDTQQYCVSWDVHRGLVTEQQLSEWAKGLPK
jgi:calcineurin-like phosphoesterase family protein